MHRLAPLRRGHGNEPADTAHRRHDPADPRAGRAAQERTEAHPATPQDCVAEHGRRGSATPACVGGSGAEALLFTLTAIDVDPDRYSTHIYRGTVATLVEQAAGITLASGLLGHANEQLTRASYVVSAEQVDPITVDILDAVLGS